MLVLLASSMGSIDTIWRFGLVLYHLHPQNWYFSSSIIARLNIGNHRLPVQSWKGCRGNDRRKRDVEIDVASNLARSSG